MSTNNGFQNFYVEGFRMVVAPNVVADATIYFRYAGGVLNIKGCDLWRKDKSHLGYVYPSNLQIEVTRQMRNYANAHMNKWVRVHTGA